MVLRRYAATIIIFICSLGVGFWIAGHKAIWNDEFYSLLASINGLNYIDILIGKIREGNNSPFFYVIQKFFLQVINYQVPDAWAKGNWDPIDYPSQFILRIIPVVCMSLSITLIFNLFYRRYSIWAGVYSLAVYGASYMLWVYWAESRPYALIVLLTTVQVYVLIRIFEDNGRWLKQWGLLAAMHILLSFTFILSLGQIAVAAVMLWCLGLRDIKKHFWLTVLPASIALYYYAMAPKYTFWFNMTPEQLVRDNFARERFYILFIMTLIVLWDQFKGVLPFKKNIISPAVAETKQLLVFIYGTLMATGCILMLFCFKASADHSGFTVANRYFIYLTPLGVIAAVWFSIETVRSLARYRWAQLFLGGVMVFWICHRFYKIVPSALRSIVGG